MCWDDETHFVRTISIVSMFDSVKYEAENKLVEDFPQLNQQITDKTYSYESLRNTVRHWMGFMTEHMQTIRKSYVPMMKQRLAIKKSGWNLFHCIYCAGDRDHYWKRPASEFRPCLFTRPNKYLTGIYNDHLLCDQALALWQDPDVCDRSFTDFHGTCIIL